MKHPAGAAAVLLCLLASACQGAQQETEEQSAKSFAKQIEASTDARSSSSDSSASSDFISAAELRDRVLEVYNTLSDAFAEMDARPEDLNAALDEEPLDLEEFTRGAAMFKKPLTEEQAATAFAGLDQNSDSLLQGAEFVGGLEIGEYFTTTTTTTSHTSTSTRTTTTHSTTSTTTTTKLFAAGSEKGTITLKEFQRCMLNAYPSPIKAFNALEMNPADINTFVGLARTFQPPLTKEQARHAFAGLDADHDQLLVSAEFFEVLKLGHFYPTVDEFKTVFTTRTTSPPPPPRLEGAADLEVEDASAFQFGLVYIILAGYLARTLFVALHLPGACGVMASGMALAYLVPGQLLGVSSRLQELLLFVTLFSTGSSVSLADSGGAVFTLALLPGAVECLALAGYAATSLGFSLLEGLALGAALFAAGDGAASARLYGLGRQFKGSHMLRFAWLAGPMEACFALGLFGAFACLAAPLREPREATAAAVFAGLGHIAASIAVGAALGYLSAKLIPMRTQLKLLGRQCFTGTATEAFILILAVGLAGFGLGTPGLGRFIPAVSAGEAPLLQPELVVLCLSAVYTSSTAPGELRGVQHATGGMWLPAQLVLFSAFGASADVGALLNFRRYLPMVAAGLAARFAGAFLAAGLALRGRPCGCPRCLQANRASLCSDAALCFLASLPRSSVQASLASGPVLSRLLWGVGTGPGAQTFIAAAARFYVVCVSVVGTILLDLVGPSLLRQSGDGIHNCEASTCDEVRLAAAGWTRLQRAQSTVSAKVQGGTLKLGLVSEDDVLFQDADAPAFPVKEAAQTLARLYDTDPSVFAEVFGDPDEEGDALGSAAAAGPRAPASYAPLRGRGLEAALGGEAPREGQVRGRAVVRRVARLTSMPSSGLFEADGGTATAGNSSAKAHSRAVRL